MNIYVRVRRGIKLRCVPITAARPGVLYQVVLKSGQPSNFVHADIRNGELHLGPMPAGTSAQHVAHLVEYPLPDRVRANNEAVTRPTAPQTIDFLLRHKSDDVWIEVSQRGGLAEQVSLN